MSASDFNKQNDYYLHYPQVVRRAGNDQLQQDIVKLIQKKYLLTSEEEAIKVIKNYSLTIQSILTKKKKTVNLSPAPMMTASSVENNLSLPQSGDLLHKEFEIKQPAKVTEENPAPVIYGCHNVVTNLRTVMSGSVMQLYGLNLDINKQDTQQGLYLIDFTGNIIKIHTLVRVKPTNIIFMIPSGLSANIYRLEIRKKLCSSEILHTCLLSGFIRVIV